MAEPEINVDRRWWKLDADTSKITSASTAWKKLGTAVDKAGDDVHTKAKVVYDSGWEGKGRTAYEGHQKKVSKALVDLKAKADAVDTALDNISSAISAKQGRLTTAETAITGAVACVVGDDKITFKPATPAESKKVKDAVEAAKGIRSDLETQLTTEAGNLDTAAADFAAASTTWQSIAAGQDPAFDLPPEAKNSPRYITLPDGRVIVNTGTGNDDVKVTTDDKGNIFVETNNTVRMFPPGTDVTVRGGQGDDTINVDAEGVNVTGLGGEGNDNIANGMPFFSLGGDSGNSTFIAGTGNDTVSTSGGDNRVSTGAGNDTVFTGDGNDNISTYDGDDSVLDYGGNNDISSGRGNDAVTAGGSNRVYSGDGDDAIHGGSGNDTIASGSGNDKVEGHHGDDRVFAGTGTDYVDGQDGNDHLEGGQDNDRIYGLDGNDEIVGGSGRDDLEGAQGNDVVDGGSGEDLVSGGYGDDDLRGGDDDDKIYAGGGRDSIDGGDGTDEAFAQDEDTVSEGTETRTETKVVDTSFIKVEGDEEFQDRIRADLNMLGSSPTGGKFMNALYGEVDETRHDIGIGEQEIVIREFDGRTNVEHQGPFAGSDVYMNYDPDSFNHGDETIGSQSVMMHELGHVYGNLANVMNHDDYVNPQDPDTENGQPISNAERQATGLDYDFDDDGDIDDVHDPDNPHPYAYTQNAFNEEAGRPRREHYGTG